MLKNLLTARVASEECMAKCEGPTELDLSEPAVMLAFAMHLFRTFLTLNEVEIHPDGEHAKKFEIRIWLETNGFRRTEAIGSTSYGGIYLRNGQILKVIPRPGEGDVVALVNGCKFVAECKGGVINTKHQGRQSKLRSGFYEAIGNLMTRPEGERLFVVVPYTDQTARLSKKVLRRTLVAGIEIALVKSDGSIVEVAAPQD